MEAKLQKRKQNRLVGYDYANPGAYFLTLCTAERARLFWDNVGATIGRPQDVVLSPFGKIVDEAICNIPKIYPAVTIDHYVIMPDHVHILLTIHADEYGRPMVAPTIDRMMQQMKGYVSKRVGRPIWQKLFADHVIRDRKDYDEHVKYISQNPTKWCVENGIE